MGELADIAKANSPFIKLNDGESLETVYKGFNKSTYKGNMVIEYQLNDKVLSSSSGKLMVQMDEVKIGSKIKITRHGTGVETNYMVEILQECQWDEDEG